MRIYKGLITKRDDLPKDAILMFGSNTQGRHKKGVALVALNHFGAIIGQAVGPQGDSYAIVTKDLTKQLQPSVPQSNIIFQIGIFYQYATWKAYKSFYVPYSGNGINLNAWSTLDMAKMFSSFPIPENMVFEESFAELLKQFI